MPFHACFSTLRNNLRTYLLLNTFYLLTLLQ